MAFKGFDVEDSLDLDALIDNQEDVEQKNVYIADSEKAVELIAQLVHNQKQDYSFTAESLKDKLNAVFEMMSDCNIPDTFEQQRKYEILCGRLAEWETVGVIKGKRIVSLGGRFSSGKSMFINAITGNEKGLPVDQNPSTSIPTYIVKSEEDEIDVNTSFGYSCIISSEAMKALSHEFYDKYKIGFSAFLENIIIKSSAYNLDDRIILLDTPGYSKADSTVSVRERNSDRQKAFAKLSITDYLIWLVDMENGTIVTEDLEFIQGLQLHSKILFVFNKADKYTDKQIREVIDLAKNTLENAGIEPYGVTAYSSFEKKEYFGNYISKFFEEIANNSEIKNDVVSDMLNFQLDVKEMIESEQKKIKANIKKYYSTLSNADNIVSIRSVAELWKQENRQLDKTNNLLRCFEGTCKALNKTIVKKTGE